MCGDEGERDPNELIKGDTQADHAQSAGEKAAEADQAAPKPDELDETEPPKEDDQAA